MMAVAKKTVMVMVVDDESGMRTFLTDVFRTHGYTVKSSDTVVHALRELDREPVDVVVADVVMPGLNGFAFGAILNKEHPEIPVVAVTGQRDINQKWLESQFDRVLFKPLLPKTLLKTVAELLRPDTPPPRPPTGRPNCPPPRPPTGRPNCPPPRPPTGRPNCPPSRKA